MKPLRLSIAQVLCRHLPPLIAQRVRSWIYPQKQAFIDNYEYVVRSQTGSNFASTTGDFHGYPFAVYGYLNWRAWAIALAVCETGDTIVEVGANIGTETVGFADIVGCEGKVFAFEPLPSNVEALTKTLKIRDCDNVIIYPIALSDKNQKIQFKVPSEKGFSGIGYITENESDDTIQVDCRTFDSMRNEIGKIKLIFMDIEGAEYDVLMGGREKFLKDRPIIVLEALPMHLSKYGYSLEQLLLLLHNLNYSVYKIDRLTTLKLSPPIAKKDKGDWIAIPNDSSKHYINDINSYIKKCGLIPLIGKHNPISRKGVHVL